MASPDGQLVLRASVRRHRRTLRGCLRPSVVLDRLRFCRSFSLMNDCHPRPVNAYWLRDRKLPTHMQ
jgi:hypothetical protein